MKHDLKKDNLKKIDLKKNNLRKHSFKKKMIPFALTLGLLLTGCGGTKKGTDSAAVSTEDTSVFKADVVNLSEGVTVKQLSNVPMTDTHSRSLSKGAVKLLLTTMEQGEKGANTLISPVSLEMAFGMLTTGAEEGSETEKELMELLMPGENVSSDTLNGEMATLSGRLKKTDGTDWNVVNSVWLKNDGKVKLKDSYISDTVNYYQAELFSAPFDQSTVDDINAWVKKNTKERIPGIIDSLNSTDSLVLLNAITFDGTWKTQIPDYCIKKNSPFTNADGTVSKVEMMLSEEHGYVEIAGGKGFLKSYTGGNYCFLGLLPPEGMSAEEYLSKMLSDEKSLAAAIKDRNNEPKLIVQFPKFSAEYSGNMNDIVKALGVTKAFDENAEFGNMITEDSEKVALGEVIHKTMIEVDQDGTKAAASTALTATQAEIVDLSETIEIYLDRPFVYGVIDMYTGIPVFLGVQNTMK